MLASRNPRRASAAVIAASALVLGACGGSDVAEQVSADLVEANVADEANVATRPTDVPQVESAREPAPIGTEPAPIGTEPAPIGTEPAPIGTEPMADVDASCLIGSWAITEDEMNGYYDTLSSGLVADGPTVEFDILGRALLTFTDTEYTYTADFDLGLVAGKITGTGISSGAVTGTWDVVDGRVVSTLADSDLSVLVTVAGATFDGGDFANGLLGSSPINDAPLDCEGPTLGFQADETGAIRHEVTLTPA